MKSSEKLNNGMSSIIFNRLKKNSRSIVVMFLKGNLNNNYGSCIFPINNNKVLIEEGKTHLAILKSEKQILFEESKLTCLLKCFILIWLFK